MNTINTTASAPVRRSVLAALLALVLAAAAFSPAVAAEEAATAATTGVVNVNQAAAAELMLLPRVGPALAARIIVFRDENGPFKAPEDLILVPGIGEKTFASMAPHVAIEGKTTLSEKVRQSRTSDE